MRDFKERYSSYSNRDILVIINNPGKYQPAAIIAAKQILAAREVTSEEISAVNIELRQEQEAIFRQEQEKKAQMERLRNSTSKFASEFNPVSMSQKPGYKTILVISILFGFAALMHLASEWSFIQFMFTDPGATWDWSGILYFGPLVYLPVCLVLFGFRNKAGWFMFTAYLLASIVSGVLFLVSDMMRAPVQYEFVAIPMPSPYYSIIGILLYAVTIWAICRQTVREIYTVNVKQMRATIIISGILAVALINSLFS